MSHATKPRKFRHARLFAALLLGLSPLAIGMLVAPSAYALEPGKDGFYQTGAGTRSKLGGKTYDIFHSIKELPATKTREALIEADVDKRFSLVFRAVPLLLKPIVGGSAWPKDKILSSFREGFAANAYADKDKIDRFLSPIAQDLVEKDNIFIQYSSAAKSTTITVKTNKVTVEGVDFMKAVWSLWFGKIDQKDLPEALMAKWVKGGLFCADGHLQSLRRRGRESGHGQDRRQAEEDVRRLRRPPTRTSRDRGSLGERGSGNDGF